MSIYIAKHYWKDKENSTWECHQKIEKSLFNYLKDNYHTFVKEKKTLIKKDKKFIYLCYEDAVDVYNRPITNITFFISKQEQSRFLCQEVYQNLEITKQEEKNKIAYTVMVLVLLIILFFSFFNKEDAVDKKLLTKENLTTNVVFQKENIDLSTLPTAINNENDFNTLGQALKELTQLNNQQVKTLRGLYKEYAKVLTSMDIHLRLMKNNKILKYIHLGMDGKKYKEDESFIVQSKVYKLNILIYEKNIFRDELRSIGQLEITKNDLIELYNKKEISRKINRKYFISLTKRGEFNGKE
jgi:hypothetical protein